MAMQDELALAGTQLPADEPGSPAWWRTRSSDELNAIFHRGIQAGDLFIAAATEMERRAREAEAARDAEQAVTVKVARRRPVMLLGALVFASLAAAAVLLLLGL
jgi:hypothetical protein